MSNETVAPRLASQLAFQGRKTNTSGDIEGDGDVLYGTIIARRTRLGPLYGLIYTQHCATVLFRLSLTPGAVSGVHASFDGLFQRGPSQKTCYCPPLDYSWRAEALHRSQTFKVHVKIPRAKKEMISRAASDYDVVRSVSTLSSHGLC